MGVCAHCNAPRVGGAKFCGQCGQPFPAIAGASDPFIGRVIGNYRILSSIGEGGMGKVYRAEQTKLHRPVCVKTLLPQFANDPKVVERFEREGIATASMRHPNIVGIIDFGRTDDGVLYIVMEYVEGRTLRQVLKEDSPVGADRAIGLIEQVLNALDEAHANNIVHRDLKPANVLVSRLRDGTDLVKVVDFGIAKLVGSDEHKEQKQLTQTGMLVGTPGYMSPEQILGQELDASSDIYSAGVILWELLAAQRLFSSQSEMELMQRHVAQNAPSPSSVSKLPLPAGLDEVVLKSLEKRPERRYRSALEFRRALDLIRGSLRGQPQSGGAMKAATPMVTSERLAPELPVQPTRTGMLRDAAAGGLEGLRGLVPDKLLAHAAKLPQAISSKEKQPLVVAFVEVTGQSALSELMDSGAVKTVVSGLMQDLAAAVERAGGLSERLLGSCLVVVFGLPRPQEDDGARCLRACLEMVELVKSHNARIARPLELRVGVHTATVIGALDEAGLSESPGVAELLSVARKLASMAPHGQPLVSRATERLSGGVARFAEHPSVPGEEKLGGVLKLTGLADAPEGTREPMSGRDAELGTLGALTDAVKNKRPGGVMFVGQPGLGKSRILLEAQALAKERGLLTGVARGGRYASSSPLDVLRQLISSINETRAPAPVDRVTNKTRLSGLRSVGVEPADIARLEKLFGSANAKSDGRSNDEDQALDRAALLQAFLVIAARAPLMLLIDDVHLADAASLEVLEELFTRTGKRPLGVVATARPGNLTRVLPRLKRLELAPLPRKAMVELIRNRLPTGQPPDQLIDAIDQRAEGNPLFAREIIRSLLESGALTLKGGAWVSTTQDDALPDSLALLLAARLDRLSEQARLLLRTGAVIGRSFPLELVVAAVDTPLDSAAAVNECVQRELLTPTSGIGVYQFTQAMTHEAVLRRMIAADIKHLHGRVAEALERGVTAGGEDAMSALARHFLAAEQPRKALKYLKLAGDRMVERNAWATAAELYRQCLALLQKESAKAGPISDTTAASLLELTSLAMSAVVMISPDQALSMLPPLLAQVPEGKALPQRALVLRQRGLALSKLSRMPEAAATFKEALDLSLRTDDPGLTANLWADLASAQEARGELGEATTSLLEGMKLLRSPRVRDKHLLWQYFNGLGRLHFRTGQLDEARDFFENARAQAKQADSTLGESKALTNLAVLAAQKQDVAGAVQMLDEAQRLADSAGDRIGVLRVRFNRGRVLQGANRAPEAQVELEAVVEAARDIGWREGEAMASQALPAKR